MSEQTREQTKEQLRELGIDCRVFPVPSLGGYEVVMIEDAWGVRRQATPFEESLWRAVETLLAERGKQTSPPARQPARSTRG